MIIFHNQINDGWLYSSDIKNWSEEDKQKVQKFIDTNLTEIKSQRHFKEDLSKNGFKIE